MSYEAVRACAGEVFALHRDGDWVAARLAVRRYRSELGGVGPDELVDLTADVESLDLEMAATLGADDALTQADALFERYARQRGVNLPSVAVFALRVKVTLLVNARRGEEACQAAEDLREFLVAHGDAARQDEICRHAVDVADMIMSGGRFSLANDLLNEAIERLQTLGSDPEGVLLARAQMLRVVALLHTGETTPLPPLVRALHAGGEDALTAIDDLLIRWGDKPAWAGARISALGHKYVLLGSLGRDDELPATCAQLDAELQELPPETAPPAEQIISETHDALLL